MDSNSKIQNVGILQDKIPDFLKKNKLPPGKIRMEKLIELQTYGTYQSNAMCETFCIPIKILNCINIYVTIFMDIWEKFKWVFEENEFIGSNFRPQNNNCVYAKKSILTVYRWFLKYLQMKWYGILNVLLNILGLQEKWVGSINKTGLTMC